MHLEIWLKMSAVFVSSLVRDSFRLSRGTIIRDGRRDLAE